MDAYQPALWHDFFVAAASAAAALTGLLFVGLSLHIRYIASDPTYRTMARGSLIGLVTVLVLSLIVLVSEPPSWTGAELVLVAAAYVVGPGGYDLITLIRRPGRMTRPTLVRSAIGQVLALMGLIGGLGLIIHRGPGLYAVAFIAGAVMVWNLWNAWVLLIGVADEEVAQEAH